MERLEIVDFMVTKKKKKPNVLSPIKDTNLLPGIGRSYIILDFMHSVLMKLLSFYP